MTRSIRPPARLALIPLALLGILLAGTLRGSKENEIGVYEVSFYLTNQVLVHLNTAPSKTNILQYTGSLYGGTWTNLFVAPILPFTNHYVIVDTRTAPQRFYRLLVLP